ncbi:MAG: GNAT family N-acetyltransferase [Caldilineaceae bacterium]|nr:GNAT family N-acetyltransferase [Caldilineaceae bacterium]
MSGAIDGSIDGSIDEMKPERIDPRVTYTDCYFHLVRDNFDAVPQHALPSGYTVRGYRPGDEVIWTALQRAAEPFFAIADELFEQQYGNAPDALPTRMWFVEDATHTAVATASAWWERDPADPADRGRIHWVAVHPTHQRRGLTKPMMTLAMNKLAQHHPAAMLGTSSGRPWAVKVYLDFGFLPESRELAQPEIVQGWHDVQSILHDPRLAAVLKQCAA